jgi:hypothetical protein
MMAMAAHTQQHQCGHPPSGSCECGAGQLFGVQAVGTHLQCVSSSCDWFLQQLEQVAGI